VSVTDPTLPGSMSQPEIENLMMAEGRRFPPDPDFAVQANATRELYEEAERDYVAFWERLARERVSWDTPFEKTLEWEPPFAKWFVGGKLNIAYNCVDRHVENGLGDKVAYHWIGEPGDVRTLTYADLQREVSKAANALLELGVKTGDRVAIYMPMIPELPIAMLACGPHRRSAYRRLRRFFGRGAGRPDRGCAGQGPDHRRWWLAARQAGQSEAGR